MAFDGKVWQGLDRIRQRCKPAVIGPWLPLLCYAVVALGYLDFGMTWDSDQYLNDCLVPAVRSSSLFQFNCFDHPMMAYALWIGAPLYLFPGSLVALKVANAVLGGVAIMAFYRLLTRVVSGAAASGEAMLVTALLALNPVFLAMTVNPSPELGTVAFVIVLVDALLAKRLWRAAVFGTLTLFTKETALPLYLLLILAYVVIYITRDASLTARAKLRALAGHAALLAPLGVFAAYAFVKTQVLHQALYHKAGSEFAPGETLAKLVDFNLARPEFRAALAELFVLNFAWVTALPLLMVAVVALWRLCLGRGALRPMSLEVTFIGAASLLSVYIYTRILPYTNPRYVFPATPFVLLAAYLAARWLPLGRRSRSGVLAALVLLVFAASFRTIDPVSRLVFGTFDFGEHQLLRMTSITGECCGQGRDQLMYNLEFTRIARLEADLFAKTAGVPLVVPRWANWGSFSTLNRHRFEQDAPALARDPRLVPEESLRVGAFAGDKACLIRLPYFDSGPTQRALAARFKATDEVKVTDDGYALSCAMLTRRERASSFPLLAAPAKVH